MFDSLIWEQWNFARKLDQAPLLQRRNYQGFKEYHAYPHKIPDRADLWTRELKKEVCNEIVRINVSNEMKNNKGSYGMPFGGAYLQPPPQIMRALGQHLKQANPRFESEDYYGRETQDYKKIMMDRNRKNQHPPSYGTRTNSSQFTNHGHHQQQNYYNNPPPTPYTRTNQSFLPPPPMPSQGGNFYPPQPQQQMNFSQNGGGDSNPYFQELLKNSQNTYGQGNPDVMSKLRSEMGRSLPQKQVVKKVVYKSQVQGQNRGIQNSRGPVRKPYNPSQSSNNFYC